MTKIFILFQRLLWTKSPRQSPPCSSSPGYDHHDNDGDGEVDDVYHHDDNGDGEVGGEDQHDVGVEVDDDDQGSRSGW